MEKANLKRKYVSPLIEELGVESDVLLLAGSAQATTAGARLNKMEEETLDDNGTGARESGMFFDDYSFN